MSQNDLISRVTRLIALAQEVRTTPTHTPESLQKALAVSRAQFFRDKKELEKAGFVFRYDRSQGKYVVAQDQFLPVEKLQLEELVALVLAAHQLSCSGEFLMADRARKGAAKLLSGLEGNLLESCVALLARQPDTPDRKGLDVVDSLQQAIGERRRVELTYCKVDREPETYEVDPYALFFRDSLLYMDGYSLKAREVRTFRASRIHSVVPTGIHYSATRGYDHPARYRDAFGIFTDAPPQPVILRFTRKIRPYIEEVQWHPSQELTPQGDGSLLFTVQVAEPREVLWWAMRWGDQAEVLEPDWLRCETQKTVERMARLYAIKE